MGSYHFYYFAAIMKYLILSLVLCCTTCICNAQTEATNTAKPKAAIPKLKGEFSVSAGISLNKFQTKQRGILYGSSDYRYTAAAFRLQYLAALGDVQLAPYFEYGYGSDKNYSGSITSMLFGLHVNSPVYMSTSGSYIYLGGDVGYGLVSEQDMRGPYIGIHGGACIALSNSLLFFIEPGFRLTMGDYKGSIIPIMAGLRIR